MFTKRSSKSFLSSVSIAMAGAETRAGGRLKVVVVELDAVVELDDR